MKNTGYNVAVNLWLPPQKSARSVRLTSPEHERVIEQPFAQKADAISFTVPAVDVY